MGIFIKPSAGEMVTAGLWALQEKDRWSLERLRNTNYTCSLWKVSLINFAYLDKGGGRIGVYAEIWMRDNSVYSGAESFVRQSICSQQKQISLDYTNKGTHLQRNQARRRGAGLQAKFQYNGNWPVEFFALKVGAKPQLFALPCRVFSFHSILMWPCAQIMIEEHEQRCMHACIFMKA